jgi:tRNA-dihydrouridine synthase B
LLIGNIEINSKLALGPMAGVTDLAFRAVCRELGAGLTYTEMVSAKALVYQDSKTRGLLLLGEAEHPAGAQIFGSDADCMAEAAALALELSGADFIDINMGCPVGKVVKSGDGSALMRDPDNAMRIIDAVRKNVSCPVTVKIRKGWDKGSVNAVEFAQMAQDAGASAIAVHGRTRTQMYSGKADWDIIRDVKQAVTVPVLANGDVFTAEDAARILRYTGADMVMVGRGALGNPWLFMQAKALLDGVTEKHKKKRAVDIADKSPGIVPDCPPIDKRAGQENISSGYNKSPGIVPECPPIGKRAETAMRQFEMAAKYKGERIACLEARKHYAWYLRGVPYSGYFKAQISKAETLDDLRKITEGIKRELKVES